MPGRKKGSIYSDSRIFVYIYICFYFPYPYIQIAYLSGTFINSDFLTYNILLIFWDLKIFRKIFIGDLGSRPLYLLFVSVKFRWVGVNSLRRKKLLIMSYQQNS